MTLSRTSIATDSGAASGAGQGLQRGHYDELQAEAFVEGFECSREADGGAVGLGYDVAFPSSVLLLLVDEPGCGR